jgi:hypothetical protein
MVEPLSLICFGLFALSPQNAATAGAKEFAEKGPEVHAKAPGLSENLCPQNSLELA